MTTFSVGSLVTDRFHGSILWVVRGPAPDGRWYIRAKKTDGRGRASYQNHTAGGGDLTLIREREEFRVGQSLTYEGTDYLVLAVGDAEIEVAVPAHDGSPLKGGGVVHIPGSNTKLLNRADLALAAMAGGLTR